MRIAQTPGLIGSALAFEPCRLRSHENARRLRPNPVAPWELRVGKMRVFYDIGEGPPPVVRVLAVGVKDRNVLRIGGQEIQL